MKECVPETSQKIFGVVYVLTDSRMEKAAKVKCLHLQIPKFKSNYRKRRGKECFFFSGSRAKIWVFLKSSYEEEKKRLKLTVT